MLQKIRSPSKLEKESKSRSQYIIKHSSVAVGLRICTEISQTESNVVVKSALRLRQPSSASCRVQPSCVDYNCFLKTCHLCNKKLCPNKDIYMYRGDQGFCSVECRNRQIVVDEMKDLEASTKQMPSYRHHRCSSGRSETLMILEDLRSRPRNPLPSHKNGSIVS